MKREEFYFDSRDNQSQIFAVRFEPDEGVEIKGVVQVVHGMAEYTERYKRLASFLTERGFVVTGEDHLGHGGSIGEKGPGYFCRQDPATVVVRDVHRLKKITQELYPSVPYIILGHSMGSFMLRNYLVRYGTGIQGAIIMGTGTQPGLLLAIARLFAAVGGKIFGEHKKGRLLTKMAFGAYNDAIRILVTPYDWLSTDRISVRLYREDPLCGFMFTFNGFATLFELIRRCQIRKDLKKIPVELPVLVVSGDEDPVGNYGRGPEKVARNLTKAGLKHVTCKLYYDDRHEILHERDRAEVMQELYDWICEQVL